MVEKKKNQKKAKLKVKSWYSNRYQIVVVQRNILLLFTLVSMFSVAIAVIFVKNVMSSKSLEPYVIEVEEKSGVATVVDQLTSRDFTGSEVMRKYFINQFVHAASGYDPKIYAQEKNKVRLLSSSGVYANFRNRINPRKLGVDSKIQVRIKSVQFTNSYTAQVRIVQQFSSKTAKSSLKNQIITINFAYAPALKLSLEDRLINPLGFQVSNYLIADEIFEY